MKVAIIKSKDPWFLPGLLTRWFTGCRAYHIGFYNERSGNFFDVNPGRRCVSWESYYKPSKMDVELFTCHVNEHYLRQMLESTEKYGWADYFSFFFRWLGFKVKNRKGVICSEAVNRDLRKFNDHTPWNPSSAPPSPCDMLEWYKNGKNQI